MKLFRKMFGNKPKQISKYESNTLAELNESPDRRTKKDEQHEVTVSNASAPAPKSKAMASAKGNNTKEKQPTAKATKGGTKSGTSSATKATKSGSGSTSKKKDATSEAASQESKKEDTKPPVKRATRTVSTTSNKKVETTDKELKSKLELSNNDDKSEAKQNIVEAAATDIANASDANEHTAEATKTTRSGRFEIKKSKDGRYVFNLYASNSVIVATSQVYSSSTAAMNGIKSVMTNASTAQIEDQTLKSVTTASFPKWEIYRDKSEHYRFRLCASNGSCVCHSQGYTSKTNCKKGIESIIKFASGAEITKAYLNKDK